MSRYQIPALNPEHTVIVGWDPPLQTFFAQVFQPVPEDSEDVVDPWLGATPKALPFLADLEAQLTPYAALPREVASKLLLDKAASRPPSPLQRRMVAFFEDLTAQDITEERL